MYLLLTLAFIGNSLTILVFLSNTRMNDSSFSVYVKSLAVTDTLVLFFKLLSYINKTSKTFYRPILCTVLIFLGEASTLISVWILVIITIERTVVILFPFYTKKLISKSRAKLMVLTTSVIMTLFSAKILIIPLEDSNHEAMRCHPVESWRYYKIVNTTINEFSYCYIPLIVVSVGNYMTLYTVRRAIFKRHNVLTNNSYREKRRSHDWNENQLMVMLLFVTLMFIVYFVPFTILNAISRFGVPFVNCIELRGFKVFLLLKMLVDFLKDLNFCTNFIIYFISGRRFRHAFISLIKCRSKDSYHASRNFESSRLSNQRPLRLKNGRPSAISTTRQIFDESQL